MAKLLFTERELFAFTGVTAEEIRSLAQVRRLGYLPADTAGGERLYCTSDLALVSLLDNRATRRV